MYPGILCIFFAIVIRLSIGVVANHGLKPTADKRMEGEERPSLIWCTMPMLLILLGTSLIVIDCLK